jgi:hypothetical protein
MIYFADDTILFSQTTRGTNELIKLTEEISKKYGLNLNKGKCAATCMNNVNDTNIHFQNNEQLEKSKRGNVPRKPIQQGCQH